MCRPAMTNYLVRRKGVVLALQTRANQLGAALIGRRLVKNVKVRMRKITCAAFRRSPLKNLLFLQWPATFAFSMAFCLRPAKM